MNTNSSHPEEPYHNIHQDLIDGCRKGYQASQFMIYKLYYKAMYNVSLKIVRDPMEAEDIMQESFLTAFEKINTYTGRAAFGSWLKRIVHNRSIDSLRKQGKMPLSDLQSIKKTDEPVEENFQDEDLSIEQSRKIKNVIGNLPLKYRNVISLNLLEGYDNSEISLIQSASESTIRSQLSRARRMIIAALAAG